MLRTIPQFLIAAPTSGTGKTTVSRLLMTLLAKRGMRVQPYKCGPDYIDTKYHEMACGRSSYNLDLFMASETHMRSVYLRHVGDADVCIIEGMMGLFDGYDRDKGSSAAIAKSLYLPVVLVVNARSAAYSLAAMIKGYMDFDAQVKLVGVIFNQVGSDRHEEMLREICADLNILCFGCLRNHNVLKEESRHLGLDFTRKGKRGLTKTLLKELERQLDIDLLLQVTTCGVNIMNNRKRRIKPVVGINIWVARNDESFSFIYAEHMDWLSELGDVTYFDPEDDSVVVPEDVDLLYLPGGYPENRAKPLSMATHVKESVKAHIERGGYTLAECGGMMYLASNLLVGIGEGVSYEMVGALPMEVSAMPKDTHLSLGYRTFELRYTKLVGHEFHYSQIVATNDGLVSAAQVYNAQGNPVDTAVFHYKNLVASYTHLYWGETGIMKLFEPAPGKFIMF